MGIREVPLTEDVMARLLSLSRAWAQENSCWGYRENCRQDIEGNRVFLAEEGGEMLGYLFGHAFRSRDMRSVMPEGSPCFEVEELYVVPARRSQGIGKALFQCACEALQKEVEYVVLSTATKNARAVLHFYLDELGMEFWSARLFKRIGESKG